MTEVRLKSKSSLSTETWCKLFTGFNTDTKSCLFIKQLTRTCISTILHLRKVFPDDYFEEGGFEGMSLKILKSRKGENYVSKIEQWLEGAFEAVEKKYLKRLTLDIQDAESDMTLEIYTMSFNYSKDNEDLNPSASYNKSGFSISNTKLNTIKLLQMCQAITQTYSELPSQVKLSMRLSYWENTPEDYQPRGFMAWEPEEPKFPKPARSLEIGITSTQHHFFKLFNKSCLSDKFFQDLHNVLAKNSTLQLPETRNKLENVPVERQTKAKRELCFDNRKECAKKSLLVTAEKKADTLFIVSEKRTSVSNIVNENYKRPEKKTRSKMGPTTKQNISSNKVTISADKRNQQVRCACLSTTETETMFTCLGCGFLVHAECYGILQFDCTKKVRFYCHLCHKMENNLKCHDKVILSLGNSSDQQKLCLLRRVLRYCIISGINTITLKKMEKILGSNCPTNVVNIVFNKIIEIGVAVAQGKRKSHLINKQTLTNQLVHYFYKGQNSNHGRNFPYSLRTSQNFKIKNPLDEFLFGKRNKNLSTTARDFLTCDSENSQQSCDIFC